MDNGNRYVGPRRGRRFAPMEDELLLYYLKPLVHGKQVRGRNVAVFDCDLYGNKDPWEIWEEFEKLRRNDVRKYRDLYFFTLKKKKTLKDSRIDRTVGSGGTWKEESGRRVLSEANQVIGFKKTFGYKNPGSPHEGRWIMHEFELHPSQLVHRRQETNQVLCILKKKKDPETKQEPQIKNLRRKQGEWPEEIAVLDYGINNGLQTSNLQQQPKQQILDPSTSTAPSQPLEFYASTSSSSAPSQPLKFQASTSSSAPWQQPLKFNASSSSSAPWQQQSEFNASSSSSAPWQQQLPFNASSSSSSAPWQQLEFDAVKGEWQQQLQAPWMSNPYAQPVPFSQHDFSGGEDQYWQQFALPCRNKVNMNFSDEILDKNLWQETGAQLGTAPHPHTSGMSSRSTDGVHHNH